MIRLSVFLVMIFTSIVVKAQTVSVTIENITSNKGKVGVALFDKENFLKKPLFRKFSEIKNGKSKVIFKDLPKGEYAISTYHDENNNGKMDFNPNGRPLENYGMSNNKVNPYGPPLFEDAKFNVEKDISLTIRL